MSLQFDMVVHEEMPVANPSGHRQKVRFYNVIEDQTPKGLLGLKHLTEENAEISFRSFDEEKSDCMTRRRIDEILEFSMACAGKRVIVGTEHRSLQKILHRLGFAHIVTHGMKEWFVKEKEEEK